ncbi:MAG: hypothetical protein KF744_08195 [Taibaiella sp.]|nr:hypothetical protein [Taibaiella sp.]
MKLNGLTVGTMLFTFVMAVKHKCGAQYLTRKIVKEDSFFFGDARWRTYAACCIDTVFVADTAQKRLGRKYFLFCELSLDRCNPDEVTNKRKMAEISYYYGDRLVTLDGAPRLCVSVPGQNLSSNDLILRCRPNKSMIIPRFGYSKMVGNTPSHMFLDGAIYQLIPEKFFDECRLKRLMEIAFNPIQPEVLKFVRENEAILNPWFLSEAHRRGLFDSLKYRPSWIDSAISAKKAVNDCYNEEPRVRK